MGEQLMKRLLAVALLAASALPAFAKEVLPFVENDYAKAVAQAKAKKTPIFVDAWAPW
jgi:hypothetical protein